MIGRKQLGDVFSTIFGDKYAIVVTDDSDVDSVLIVTDGYFNSPSVDMVIRSALLSSQEIDKLWRDTYYAAGLESAKKTIAGYWGSQAVQVFTAYNYQDYESFRRTLQGGGSVSASTNHRADGNGRKNDRTDGESDLRKAPDNGAFFDAENETELSKRSVSEAQRKADRETLILVTERMPTPAGLTERKENEVYKKRHPPTDRRSGMPFRVPKTGF